MHRHSPPLSSQQFSAAILLSPSSKNRFLQPDEQVFDSHWWGCQVLKKSSFPLACSSPRLPNRCLVNCEELWGFECRFRFGAGSLSCIDVQREKGEEVGQLPIKTQPHARVPFLHLSPDWLGSKSHSVVLLNVACTREIRAPPIEEQAKRGQQLQAGSSRGSSNFRPMWFHADFKDRRRAI